MGVANISGNILTDSGASLSSYLPLTGGTLTGALNGTSALFTGTITSNNAIGVEKNGSNTFGGGGRFYLYNAATTDGLLMQLNASNNLDFWGVTSNTPSASPVIVLTRTGAATFSSSVTSNGIISNYGRMNGRLFITNENDYGDMTSTTGMISISYYPAGQEATIRSRNYSTSTNTKLAFDASQFTFSGGNVGIGTSVPQYSLALPQDSKIGWNDAGSSKRGSITVNSASDAMVFTTGTSDAERMRITSGGQVLIGQTTASGSSNGIYFRPGIESGFIVTSDIALQLGRLSTTGDIQSFYSGTTRVGTISVSSSNTSYNTSSDYRLKEDLKDYNGLDLVSKIKTYDFAWKNDQTRNYGVIAHEIAEIIPYVVMGEKDGEFYQGVDYSKLVPVLVKAIQELSAKVTALENK